MNNLTAEHLSASDLTIVQELSRMLENIQGKQNVFQGSRTYSNQF